MQTQRGAGIDGRAWRIMIVDDHPLLRLGITRLLEDENDLRVCCEADTIGNALQALEAQQPHLLITDLSLAGSNGLVLIKRVRSRYPNLPILVCSMHDEGLFAYRALNAGAMGYISKEEATRRIVEAVRQVLAGKIWISETMAERVLQGIAGGGRAFVPGGVESLSNRELEVFGLIGRGVKTSQIADQLHLSVKTVETHRDNIKKKLNLKSGGELARRAIQWVLEQA